MDNEVILHNLRKEDKKTLSVVYKRCQAKFFHTLSKDNTCEGANIKDLYHIAILRFYENILQEKLTQLTNLEGYIIGIGRNLCKEYNRNRKTNLSLLDWYQYDEFPQKESASAEKEQLSETVQMILGELSETCQAILKAKFYNHWSMDQIAQELGYQNAAVVRNIKYRCINKFRARFQELHK